MDRKTFKLFMSFLVLLVGCGQTNSAVKDFKDFGLSAPKSSIREDVYQEDRWFGEASDYIIYEYDDAYVQMLDAVELESWTVQKTQYNQVASGSLQSMQGTFDSIDFTQKAKACGSYDGYLIETKHPSTNPETQAYIMVCEEIGEMIFIFSYW